jgi:hypothetical protein
MAEWGRPGPEAEAPGRRPGWVRCAWGFRGHRGASQAGYHRPATNRCPPMARARREARPHLRARMAAASAHTRAHTASGTQRTIATAPDTVAWSPPDRTNAWPGGAPCAGSQTTPPPNLKVEHERRGGAGEGQGGKPDGVWAGLDEGRGQPGHPPRGPEGYLGRLGGRVGPKGPGQPGHVRQWRPHPPPKGL